MKIVKFEYDIGDEVEIIAIHCRACVQSLWFGERGASYEVAYWVDGDRKKEYLFAHEIKPIKEATKAGFIKGESNGKRKH